MVAKVLLHIRRETDGRAVVTPVEFGQLARDGSSVAAAKRKVMPGLTAHISQLAPQLRHRMNEEPRSHLVELVVTRPASDDSEAIELPMGVVVTERESRGKPTFVAYAPTVRQFSVGAKKLADVLVLATTRLATQLGWMPVANAMACAETGEASLEVVDVEIADGNAESEVTAQRPAPNPAAESVVRDAGVELTAATKRRAVAGVEVRESLLQRILIALATPERSSVVLVGRPDVGKTALIHEVANRIANKAVPPGLAERPLWRLNANDLIAGAMFTGQWQGRGQAVIQLARATRAIFAMGEPGEIIDAGRHYRSDNNLSRLFRPYMENGELSLLCECTVEAYAAARKLEPSFIDAFHRIDVPEPTASETHQILTHTARSIEAAQKVVIEPGATDAAIELTRRFEPYRGLPGKSVRLLEESVRSAAATVESIGRTEVVQAFAARSGMPLAMLSDDVALRADDIAEYLTARVIGQPEAVDAVVGVVMVVKAALYDSQKPLATLLFVGPTGVGKTELVKALAEYLFGSRDRVVRLDMAEYGTADAIQRLTGTTWTTEGESDLIRRIREQPFSVVLLDEIEKAHPSVYDALLALTGEGRLTDARGRTADFRNAILVMTSNLGSARVKTASLGFAADVAGSDEAARIKTRYVDQVEKFFRPEFVNRIDRVIVFRNLDRGTVVRIARRELGHLLLREGIVRRGLLVEFDDRVVEALAETGFHPRYGARPLQREIERAVIQPLARLLVEADPHRGDLIRVSRQGSGVALDLQRMQEARPSRAVRQPEFSPAQQRASMTREFDRAKKLLANVMAAINSEAGQYVQAQRSRIIVETSDPDFWDRPPAARESMSRLYLYQRLVDDISSLRDRAEGLVELAKHIRRAQNRDRLGELRKALVESDGSLERLTLEINAARIEGGPESASLRITPIGGAANGWADELAAMYWAWAERTGREVTKPAGANNELIIEGPASVALLAGEAGLHRRIADVYTDQLARVVVAPLNGRDGAASRSDAQRASVVRIYDVARRYVRDPRTGVLVKDLASVLREGKIDQFIIAMLSARS